jgi:hypothetical protein
MISIQKKLRQYYPEELEIFNQIMGEDEDYWGGYVQECCPELAGLINL